ncbi:hypothetical protein ACJ73_05039 [Blastomyces percursus]|uniref:Uncharacterized protein n=1 Tax=Blastomyces percursus TaxID=1658174 RepID=A0A1J9QTQ2_9EURO|nr:hypothetical protein ACJ73_05039 [Blastomyces percursus]
MCPEQDLKARLWNLLRQVQQSQTRRAIRTFILSTLSVAIIPSSRRWYTVEELAPHTLSWRMCSIVTLTLKRIEAIRLRSYMKDHEGYQGQIQVLSFFLRSWRRCMQLNPNRGGQYTPTHRYGKALANLLEDHSRLRNAILANLQDPPMATLIAGFHPVYEAAFDLVAEVSNLISRFRQLNEDGTIRNFPLLYEQGSAIVSYLIIWHRCFLYFHGHGAGMVPIPRRPERL